MSSSVQGNLFGSGLEPTADISPCGRYRWSLGRRWNLEAPMVCWIMLNPSTADASVNDPTIRRCMSLANQWNAGGILVVNLFALRATDPQALYANPTAAIGDGNDLAIRTAAEGRQVICAWGNHGGLIDRARAVLSLLAGQRLWCLGLTKCGHPRHPLYIPDGTQPVPLLRVR